MKAHRFLLALAAAAALISPAHAVVKGKPVHAISLYGEPQYGPDYTHFNYVNPDAPKGGQLTLSNEAFLTFDSFNPFIIKGAYAYGTMLMHDTLMESGLDEPFTMYGRLAQTVEVAPDNSWVEFVLWPQAKFSDGSPITADDVVFSYNTLTTKGMPVYRMMYADVDKVEKTGDRKVRFTFKVTTNRELPLILGQFAILSQAYWSTRDFGESSLDIPVSSGPYTVDTFDPGRSVTYKRVAGYWGENLPINKGQNNFDRVRYEYFRDEDVQFEAFKTNTFDFYRETKLRRWSTGFDFPAAKEGKVTKLEVPSTEPFVGRTVVLNLRRPMFQDRRVRQAINLAFDFESLNKNVFYGLNTRLRSYWQNSELEAKGLPSADEIKMLEPFRDKVPPEVFTTEYSQPTTAGNGDTRENLLKARALLEAAGWTVKDGRLVDKAGKPFDFEFMAVDPTLDEIFSAFFQNLDRLGIKATMRVVDTAQYSNRINDFDYDTFGIIHLNGSSPGNEQLEFWGSESADRLGSFNYSGVKDPVVDALAKTIIAAEDRATVVTATHALDRVLTWNAYRIVTYSSPVMRFVHWNKIKRPDVLPKKGILFGEPAVTLWWADPAAAAPATAQTPAENSGGGESRNLIVALLIAAAGFGLLIAMRRRRS